MIGDSVTFVPNTPMIYNLTCLGTELTGAFDTRTYMLEVQNPVSFTASVGPSVKLVNNGSKYLYFFI